MSLLAASGSDFSEPYIGIVVSLFNESLVGLHLIWDGLCWPFVRTVRSLSMCEGMSSVGTLVAVELRAVVRKARCARLECVCVGVGETDFVCKRLPRALFACSGHVSSARQA